jgi:hypothetical protein
MFLHTRKFLRERLSELLPSDTVFIGSVRHPYWQQLSWFEYFGEAEQQCQIKRARYSKPLNARSPIEQCFQKSIQREINGNRNGNGNGEEDKTSGISNQQAIDLGIWSADLDQYQLFNVRSFDDHDDDDKKKNKQKKTLLDRLVAVVAHRFSFLLVSDYLNESLVMLRRLMSWDTLDIFYLSTNQQYRRQQSGDSSSGHFHTYQEHSPSQKQDSHLILYGQPFTQQNQPNQKEGGKHEEKGRREEEEEKEEEKKEEEEDLSWFLSPNEAARIRSPIDWAIYQYANSTLHQLIKQEGSSFQKELESFVEARQQVEDFCRDPHIHHCSSLHVKDWQGHPLPIYPSFCSTLSQQILPRLRHHQQNLQPCSRFIKK